MHTWALSANLYAKPVFWNNTFITAISSGVLGFIDIEHNKVDTVQINGIWTYYPCIWLVRDHLYVYGGDEQTLMIYDLKKRTLIEVVCASEYARKHCDQTKVQKYGLVQTGRHPECLVLDNQVHIIGGDKSNKHLVSSFSTNLIQLVVVGFMRTECDSSQIAALQCLTPLFMQFYHGNMTDRCCLPYVRQQHVFADFSYAWGCRLVYSQYLRRFMLLGGHHGYWSDRIYFYDVDTQQWTLSEVRLPHKNTAFGCIAFASYVVIFGGYLGYDHSTEKSLLSDEIYVLDLNTMKWTLSAIKCPRAGQYHAVLREQSHNVLFVHLFGFQELNSHHMIRCEVLLGEEQTDSLVK